MQKGNVRGHDDNKSLAWLALGHSTRYRRCIIVLLMALLHSLPTANTACT